MAEQLPQNFIIPNEGVVASYNYEDIADGRGLKTLYGYVSVVSGGTVSYNLDPFIVASSYIDLDEVGITSDTTLTFYTGSFNKPRVMQGRFFLTFCHKTSANANHHVTVKLYHYDGTTSTQLGSTWTGVTFNNTNAHVETAMIDVDTPVKFKLGDKIKIEIAVDLNAAATWWMGTDPLNRDGVGANEIKPSTDENATTQLVVRAPFRIEY